MFDVETAAMRGGSKKINGMIVFPDELRMDQQRDLNWRKALQKRNPAREISQTKGKVMINNSNIIENSTAVVVQQPTASQPPKGKRTGYAKLAFVGLAALSMVGCVGRFTGGGSIDSIAGAPEKATFGFVIDAVNPDEDGNPTTVKGQFQFNDHAAGVRFHVNQLSPALFARIYPDISAAQAVMFAYNGTYSCDAGTGELELGVASDKQGLFGTYNKDAVFVAVSSGPYAGYENIGLVQNGKIQFAPAKSK